MKIYYTPRFSRKFKKLPEKVKNEAVKREKIFRKNPFEQKIETHKLHGDLKEFWSFSINHKYRIIFDFENDNKVVFYDVGKHDIY
ncbi:type II toxin-antitoxin system mRNA interferase toxin, RelE/StbE family [Patescibacteria group bacterium]|nr:type II toxin-antitoxin system mRNA interferase toxin, RelE/StbE family [Patescibacteria group bacterium]MBU4057399.1 type II toxin-antitoxin system mRNA interferase toxin, RelE/StbE family [Patescibacteria group bacterium]MBU4115848.1 type II toxin-antitoxin system mRNA interferase toxin, RelE/StbE family [Patescibacteria group bacterium]